MSTKTGGLKELPDVPRDVSYELSVPVGKKAVVKVWIDGCLAYEYSDDFELAMLIVAGGRGRMAKR